MRLIFMTPDRAKTYPFVGQIGESNARSGLPTFIMNLERQRRHRVDTVGAKSKDTLTAA